jgi:hypothetical protein
MKSRGKYGGERRKGSIVPQPDKGIREECRYVERKR